MKIHVECELFQHEDGFWLHLNDGQRSVMLSLNNHGPLTQDIIDSWAKAQFESNKRPETIAQRVYNLATTLWYRLIPDTRGGHPGVAGPSSEGVWTPTQGNLEGAAESLEQVLKHVRSNCRE